MRKSYYSNFAVWGVEGCDRYLGVEGSAIAVWGVKGSAIAIWVVKGSAIAVWGVKGSAIAV
ncbi:MAG: hypothetical protein ACLBM1_17640 [Cuspidothrix sp.]